MTQCIRALCLGLVVIGVGGIPAFARVTVEAARGTPFGVAKVTINPIDSDAMKLVLNNGFGFDDPNGRILYPVFVPGKFAQFLNNVLKPEESIPPSTITVYFLFRGDDPFAASLYSPGKDSFRVVPDDRQARLHTRLLEEWWKEYRRTLRSHDEEGAYPKNIDAYLEASLASRMRLPLDPVSDKKKRDGSSASSLHLLVGSEQAKADLIHGAFGRTATTEIRIADPPVPMSFPESVILPIESDVSIEPIALRTPRECFYVHFGRFNHFLWLSDLLQDYGGDIKRMAVLRGQSKSMNEQIERRLGVKRNALAKLLGESVVNDIAIVGRDAFFDEGPAIGVLLHAKNNLILTTDLGRQRGEALAREKSRGGKEERIRILDRDASFMSTPDHAFRSIMVSDGDFHLVTTSMEIATRFLETREGEGSLGQTAEFRATRLQFPTDRKDTIFAYFSSYFFQGLLTPQYQIEQRRRLTSLIEMEMLTLARMSARAEGLDANTAEALVAAGFLPKGFGQRADGSTIMETADGFADALRGARGSFLPITDVPMSGVSIEEAAAYEELSKDWRGRQLDPLMVAIRHEHGETEGVERLHIDARASLLDREKYKVILDSFGPPTTTAITRPADDIVHIQAVLTGNPIVKTNAVSHLILGVKDMPPLEKLKPEGLLRTLDFIRSTPGYLAAWPRMGLLALLPIRIGPEQTSDGIQRLLFGVWRLRSGDLTAFSFDQHLLIGLPEQIRPVETERPAQVRVEVADLTKTQLSGWINAISFERARQTSTANIKAVHWISQQFRTPRNECLLELEKYVGAKLVCVLGGEYSLVTTPSGLEYWESSEAALANATERPVDYQAPFLSWFRGLRLEGIVNDTQVELHGFVDLMRKDSTKRSGSSIWDLLNGAPKPGKAEEIPPPLPIAPAEEVAPPPGTKRRAF
jgi:hypothetical protein